MAGDITADDAMQAVFEAFGTPALEIGIEFTEAMYAEKHRIPTKSVGRQLQDAIKAGKLTRRWVIHDGRRRWGYRLVV
jgi:hypothetical protein